MKTLKVEIQKIQAVKIQAEILALTQRVEIQAEILNNLEKVDNPKKEEILSKTPTIISHKD